MGSRKIINPIARLITHKKFMKRTFSMSLERVRLFVLDIQRELRLAKDVTLEDRGRIEFYFSSEGAPDDSYSLFVHV